MKPDTTKPMRRLLLLAGVAVLGIVTFLVDLSMRPRVRINQESFDRIQIGMTQLEVEEILGGPPDRYTGRRGTFSVAIDSMSSQKQWIGDEGTIYVQLSWDRRKREPGRVQHKDFLPAQPETLGERLDRTLSWLWE